MPGSRQTNTSSANLASLAHVIRPQTLGCLDKRKYCVRLTDHFSHVCLLSSSKEFHGVKSKQARDFSSVSVDQFKTAISTINWIDIIGNFGTDVNRAFSTFYKKLNKVVNKFAPIRELSKRKLKQLSKPWITKGIRHSIKIKKKLFASGDQARYKIYRNKLRNLIRLSKKDYHAKYFNDNVTNMKKKKHGRV